MEQAEVFMRTEGDAWLKRNAKKLPIEDDLVLAALSDLVGWDGGHILEIGCSNGWRLKELKSRYKCGRLVGVDPSPKAVEAAKKAGVEAVRGFAHSLSMQTGGFDLVILGFCLYVCDRSTLFSIATEADRVLRDGGIMAVYDFAPERPCKRSYAHQRGLWTYKQDYDQMFLWNPAYKKLITKHHRDGQTKATLMRKSIERGWPECA